MSYQPVEKFPNLLSIEHELLAFWSRAQVFEKLRERNRGKPRWSFLDGPITANNPMGVHHAWGRTLKDVYQRYHAMCGHELRYQNGFDCQGLWVEVEVEKEHGFKSKQDIERYGIAKFVEDCKNRVRKFSKIQTEQSIRLGYWMDWNDSYYTMSDENNYTIWRFLKTCHEHGFIYKGFDVMPWCPRCGTGLSQMELYEGYKWVEHLSVMVRFPLVDRNREALLVWTTTPWTLAANVAAAVHPGTDYLKIRVGEWTYYVGKENYHNARLVEQDATAEGGPRAKAKLQTIAQMLSQHGKPEIVAELKGRDLLGLRYVGPFDDLPAQQRAGGHPHPDERLTDTAVQCHRVIGWDQVTGTEGTGVVHIAPGCGKEDYELGKTDKLVCVAPLDEAGRYGEGFDWLTGRSSGDVAEAIAADLKQRGVLLGLEQYPHRYPHCWRDGTELVYRLVDEWYIAMDWRDEIIKTVPKITWIPEYGKQLEMDWLRNMGDWMISKKRYWGLALPIWQCDRRNQARPEDHCDWFTVIGSGEELKERSTAGWDQFEGHSPHRPWVDQVKIRCEKCGGTASRIADVGNPWLDAGIVPYSTMRYNTDPAYFEQWFPPDLVLESFPGQFRNWFYALLAMNAMMQQDRWSGGADGESRVVPPFKRLLGHALVRDEHGREMHKSLGNAIEFNAAADTVGAEVLRYIYAAQNPAINLNFPDISQDRDKSVIHHDQEVYRKLLTLWNCYSFYITYASVDQITAAELAVPLRDRAEIDRWVISKFQRLVRFAHECFQNQSVNLLMPRYEAFVEDLSAWYIRRSRRRFWKSQRGTDKFAAYATLFETLEGLCGLMAPILPFLTEAIYQNLVRSVLPEAPESVHLNDYPAVDPARIDGALEERIDAVIRYKNLGLRLRQGANIKVRQPLRRLLIKPGDDREAAILRDEELRTQLLEEINVKRLELVESTDSLLGLVVKPNLKAIGQKFGRLAGRVRDHLGQADPGQVQGAIGSGGTYRCKIDDQDIELAADDLIVEHVAPQGLVFLFDDDAFVALDTTIDEELRREGIARDFVRAVQTARKERGLRVDERIVLRYHAGDRVREGLEGWSAYIRQETLATEFTGDLQAGEGSCHVGKVAGERVLFNFEVAAEQKCA